MKTEGPQPKQARSGLFYFFGYDFYDNGHLSYDFRLVYV